MFRFPVRPGCGCVSGRRSLSVRAVTDHIQCAVPALSAVPEWAADSPSLGLPAEEVAERTSLTRWSSLDLLADQPAVTATGGTALSSTAGQWGDGVPG